MAGGSGVKTNEREGTRAVARYIRISPYKVRAVLDLVRGEHVHRAAEILRFCERDAAYVVGKVLASAVANAENNDGLVAEDLFVATAYADEGVTLKRFRPRARGRAGRIRKRTCHVTLIVSRMPDAELARYRAKAQAEASARRTRRVAAGRAGQEGGGRFRRNRGRAGDAAAPAEAGAEVDDVLETEDQIEAEESIGDAALEVAETAEVVEDATDAGVEAAADEAVADEQNEESE